MNNHLTRSLGRRFLTLVYLLSFVPEAFAGPVLLLDDPRGVASTALAATSGGPGLQPGRSAANMLGAFNIVVNAGGGLTGDALAAFNRAAAQWEAFISDPIVVNISANLAPLSAGIIGSTNAVVLSGTYAEVRDAVVLDAANEVDDAVVAFLPTAATASFDLPPGFDLDGKVQLTKANAKALGFTGLDNAFGSSDGSITFSSNFAFDFDNSDGVSPGQMDFETAAVHEIGHALGFISDVDFIDALMSANATSPSVEPSTLDLFRFRNGVGNDPETFLEFSLYPRSMVPGATEFFDQVAGQFGGSPEVLFSTGLTQGDGRQASHWKDNLSLGVMDPTLSFGELSPITPNDLRAFDLIGYEITAVPEVGAWIFGVAAACVGRALFVLRRPGLRLTRG